MDMESHKGMSSSGKLYGFGLVFADELSATKFAEELEVARVADELVTAGVICCSLDDDTITYIETSEELDSGMYRSIW